MRYRIVHDEYAGYEVQLWRWWYPVWVQAESVNTHSTVDGARRWARKKYVKNIRVVEKGVLK